MALQIGIIGLPNVGKSTLFNALTRSRGAEAANYPFCTIEPNVGVVEVPDHRLKTLADLVKPEKVVPAAIEFVDIAGLVKGASKGEGLGNQFLHAVREVDALCHVVRVFEDGNVAHVDNGIDPRRDRETIETELVLADLETIQKRIEKVRQAAKTGDGEKQKERAVAQTLFEALNEGRIAQTVHLNEDEGVIAKSFHLLTRKPTIYAANVSEEQMQSATLDDLQAQVGAGDPSQVIKISAKIEEDLQDLSPDEALQFLQELGVQASGLDQLIRAAYAALGYITFFTAGPKEVRAWNIAEESTAQQAAGTIHTDFQRGFICAETIAYDDYVAAGSEQKAKEAGRMRTEGKHYIVKDGDILHFRFNV